MAMWRAVFRMSHRHTFVDCRQMNSVDRGMRQSHFPIGDKKEMQNLLFESGGGSRGGADVLMAKKKKMCKGGYGILLALLGNLWNLYIEIQNSQTLSSSCLKTCSL